MNKKQKVLVGLSGGVDSSVAAALLVDQGYEVEGITLQVWEEEDETAVSKRWQERSCCKVGIAKHVCQKLGIPHHIIDTRATFRRAVIDDFIAGYTNGLTPNPCVRCNERVKFGMLYRLACERGADFVATGHYARILRSEEGQCGLFKGADQRKDQTYFLYRISPSWLPRILFPVGHLQKTEVWAQADRLGLPADELKESQEICFVTQGDYRQFLRSEVSDSQRPGPFLDMEGKQVGRHEGIAYYTPGQRKGLGLATGKRVYVHHVDPENNAVVIGTEEEVLTGECWVDDLNMFDTHCLQKVHSVEVKIRYAAEPIPGTIHGDEETGQVHVEFSKPQFAISPGQSAVFYKGCQVLGGGIIQSSVTPLPIASVNHMNSESF